MGWFNNHGQILVHFETQSSSFGWSTKLQWLPCGKLWKYIQYSWLQVQIQLILTYPKIYRFSYAFSLTWIEDMDCKLCLNFLPISNKSSLIWICWIVKWMKSDYPILYLYWKRPRLLTNFLMRTTNKSDHETDRIKESLINSLCVMRTIT